MLPLPDLQFAPESLSFTRNNKSIVAHRLELTTTPVRASRITIGDSAAVQYFSPIRVRPDNYRCFLYRWTYGKEHINVCVVITPSLPQKGRIVELSIDQDFAPHVPGIPVDSAEISVVIGSMTFTIASGLGDGCYPVFAFKRWLRLPSTLVVDFKIWEMRANLILREHQRFDDFGMVYDSTDSR